MKTLFHAAPVCLGLLLAGLVYDGAGDSQVLIGRAEAVVGRPLTPVSVAGVARRTTWRMVVASSYPPVPALPPGCVVVDIDGTPLHQCGSTYYQVSGGQYKIVTVQ